MQQFVVPQFIEVEDKILGPITVRQFLIMLIAGIIIFIVYRFADTALFLTLALFIGGIALLFAFAKVKGQAFHYFILNIIQTKTKPGLRIWRKEYSKKELDYLRKKGIKEDVVVVERKKVRRARIKDLALVVNTGGYYRPDNDLR
ncbi:MAG: PrgI family protein [Candidatus Magasanikbacteria bacterium]|jgi:hypothetical protein|nr:PrgI family protein [Candidatus Magasanikbacteria bacterium]MBT4221529.1 PrgI family protein [Candidatus Magasanikbacteria bacterium]MBT4350480.1 PrgI family protein [Candidatus Magasanikbacteria bacterium]MBT4541870.1 PrgI family protein [Candidatus Magasanikbacteria bacterium]MBT6253108.1 PrgI family protein [Candidatus Magasanikbacteria bacterium]